MVQNLLTNEQFFPETGLRQVFTLEGTIIQIEKQLKNVRLRVSNISSKFRIPIIYYFAVTYSWNLLLCNDCTFKEP